MRAYTVVLLRSATSDVAARVSEQRPAVPAATEQIESLCSLPTTDWGSPSSPTKYMCRSSARSESARVVKRWAPLLCLVMVGGAIASAAAQTCPRPPPCDTVQCATQRRAQGLRYRIPTAPEADVSALEASDERLNNEAVITFIHIFKAGGSTVKNVLTLSALLAGWFTSIAPSDIGWPSFVAEPEETRSIPRYISGAHGLGHCELTARPCMYFTVLRDPIDRLVSEYDYFCVKGREQRKEWSPDWKHKGVNPHIGF